MNVKEYQEDKGNEVSKLKAPRLTMTVLMQSRASFSNGNVVGVDGISAEILKNIAMERTAENQECFCNLSKEHSNVDIETWLSNIVLVPKKKVIDRQEGQTRDNFVQSVLAKWYCGCLTILMETEMRNMGREQRYWRTSTLSASRNEEVRLRLQLP